MVFVWCNATGHIQTINEYKAVMQSHRLYKHISGVHLEKLSRGGQKSMVEKLWEGITSLVPHTTHSTCKFQEGANTPPLLSLKRSPGIFAKTRPNQTCWSDYMYNIGTAISFTNASGGWHEQSMNHRTRYCTRWKSSTMNSGISCTHSLYFTCMTKSPTPCLLDVA